LPISERTKKSSFINEDECCIINLLNKKYAKYQIEKETERSRTWVPVGFLSCSLYRFSFPAALDINGSCAAGRGGVGGDGKLTS
jgi:hypothetical protein